MSEEEMMIQDINENCYELYSEEYVEQLQQENHTLNKGIDELLKKYENILQHLEKSQAQRFNHTYQIKIDLIKEYKEDLKNLKGE